MLYLSLERLYRRCVFLPLPGWERIEVRVKIYEKKNGKK
jgi:hypothetical protein